MSGLEEGPDVGGHSEACKQSQALSSSRVVCRKAKTVWRVFEPLDECSFGDRVACSNKRNMHSAWPDWKEFQIVKRAYCAQSRIEKQHEFYAGPFVSAVYKTSL